MSPARKIVIAGASGICGSAAWRHFARLPDWKVVGVSRRAPPPQPGAEFVSVDLLDKARCEAVFSTMTDVTHVAYVAMSEDAEGSVRDDVVSRWTGSRYQNDNLAMLVNVIEPLDRVAPGLCHITITQGGRAYGAHLGPIRIPAVERAPRHPHANFYWLQEDYLKSKQQGRPWHWTVLRPRGVEGDSIHSSTNRLFVIGVYGAICRELGLPFGFPGRGTSVREATDAALFARALEWAAVSPQCRDQTFNISNGDVFEWRYVWPRLAEELGLESRGGQPMAVADFIVRHAQTWRDIVARYDLQAPADVQAFLRSAQLLDHALIIGPDDAPNVIVSTIKARQAGFQDCMDTEEMMCRYLRRFRELRLLPPR